MSFSETDSYEDFSSVDTDISSLTSDMSYKQNGYYEYYGNYGSQFSSTI